MGGQSAVKPFLRRSNVVVRIPKVFTVVMILLVSLLVASCKNNSSNADSELAAKVGPQEITIKQLDSAIKQQMDASGNTVSFTSDELVSARLSVLDSLIQEEALFLKAQKENLVPDENKVTQEIQKTKQDAQLTEDQYQNQIKQAGLTEEDFRDKVRKRLAIAALQDREKTRVSAPTDAEIERYYNDRRSQMIAEAGVDLAIIVSDPANNGATDDAVGDQAAENKIKAIYEQLRGGADFATIARQRSEHQSGANGGNLGFGNESQLRQIMPSRPDIAQRLLSMNPGQYTEPIKDNISGQWVIFKLNGKRTETKNLTLDDVRKNIIDAITQQRQQILLNALLMSAISEADIKNYLAERIVENPKAIVEMSPSRLLEQTTPAKSEQPQPRIENENQSGAPASNSNSAAASNKNTSK